MLTTDGGHQVENAGDGRRVFVIYMVTAAEAATALSGTR
jgi:hypothetical protein